MLIQKKPACILCGEADDLEEYMGNSAPMGDSYEVYSYEWASGSDHAQNVMGFILGIFAAIAVALLFYCIARFIADPIMYRIDLKTDMK